MSLLSNWRDRRSPTGRANWRPLWWLILLLIVVLFLIRMLARIEKALPSP